MAHIILLSGGSGSRLWPLSNESRSKQFLKVLRDESGSHVSMVQRTYAKIKEYMPDSSITIATSESQSDSVRQQLEGDYNVVLEPERRDTAPAIMLACAHLAYEQHAPLDDAVIVMPIDSFAGQDYYERIPLLAQAVLGNNYDIALLGVRPTEPSEKYGYIVPEETIGNIWQVATFREKPDKDAAITLIEHGALWNCGVFAFQLSYLMGVLEKYLSSQNFEYVHANYTDLPKNSFDYEVIEHANNVCVIPFQGLWKDLGTWGALTEEMADFVSGRVVFDAPSCHNSHVINETGLPMVVAGIANAVIVATPDGILACGKEESAGVKQFVAEVSAGRPMYEKRRWGEYRVLDLNTYPSGNKSLTKELVLYAGAQISYQRHHYRSEIWTVVSGSGEAVLNDKIIALETGSVICIGREMIHALRALSEMHVIEVQLGDPLTEEDIERFGYYWR